MAAASLSVAASPALAGTKQPARWTTGGAVWTTKSKAFKKFIKKGEITDRALLADISRSGSSAEDLQAGLKAIHKTDVRLVARFLYSKSGKKFLKAQTAGYKPFRKGKKTAVVALRSAIILASKKGKLTGAGIIKNLPVAMKVDGAMAAGDGTLVSYFGALPAAVKDAAARY
jgi:hypothetical protein